MIEPIIRAAVDLDAFIFIEVARIEWQKFDCKGPAEVAEEFYRCANLAHSRLHLDHIPVIDEEGDAVDYLEIIRTAIDLGYHSVMVDGSALDLARNIEATQRVVDIAHSAGIPCEAELGAIAREGHGPSLSYQELFAKKAGFTDSSEATRFVDETQCDWLSVSVGSIHGAVSGILKEHKKTEARLHLEHLEKLRDATKIPLVLHGGSGIPKPYIEKAIKRGISKVNIGFEIRRAYEIALRNNPGDAQAARQAVYTHSCFLIEKFFNAKGSKQILFGENEG
jgi:fructose/tagatose bisphosphate aldolase